MGFHIELSFEKQSTSLVVRFGLRFTIRIACFLHLTAKTFPLCLLLFRKVWKWLSNDGFPLTQQQQQQNKGKQNRCVVFVWFENETFKFQSKLGLFSRFHLNSIRPSSSLLLLLLLFRYCWSMWPFFCFISFNKNTPFAPATFTSNIAVHTFVVKTNQTNIFPFWQLTHFAFDCSFSSCEIQSDKIMGILNSISCIHWNSMIHPIQPHIKLQRANFCTHWLPILLTFQSQIM